MYQEKGFKTIFDDVKAYKIEKANIPEDEIVKPKSSFHINNDKFDSTLIVNDYKMPSFKFIQDDSLNDFFNFPDISLSQNPIYKYKYPKLSEAEYAKQQMQTEAGTPNELNTFMRHDQSGQSIQDIQKDDDAYQSGLKQIQEMIAEDTQKIKSAFKQVDENTLLNDDEKAEAKAKLGMKAVQNVKQLHTYKVKNPVLIKPAKEYAEKIENVYLSKHPEIQPKINSSKPVVAQPAAPSSSKPAVINKSLPVVAQPATPSSPAAQKTKTGVSSPAMQKAGEYIQKVNSKKATKKGEVVNESKSAEPAEPKASEPDENDEVDTVIGDVVKVPQHLQQYYIEAQNILNSTELQRLRPQVSLDTTQKGNFFSIFEELNSLNLAVSNKKTVQPIKKVGTFRNKFLIQFKT